MRLFEILTLVTLLLALLSFFVPRPKRPQWMAFLPSLVVLLVLAHLVLEGYRWQMVPAYALTVLTFLASVRGIMQGIDTQGKPSSPGRRALTIIGTVLGLLVLIIAAALPALFPVYRLQKPTQARAPAGLAGSGGLSVRGIENERGSPVMSFSMSALSTPSTWMPSGLIRRRSRWLCSASLSRTPDMRPLQSDRAGESPGQMALKSWNGPT
jgi:hypothetical protein